MSSILSASDLNDFISPGLACIKPAGEVRLSSNSDSNNVEIQINDAGEALEVSIDDGTVQELPSASISLQDCLACSGCITSAEEVLLAKQTHKVLLEDLAKYKDEKVFCMSISHQSRLSIADVLGLSVYKVDEFLINFFSERYGFKFVVGTELGRVLSLNKINDEVIQRKVSGVEKKTMLSSVCPGFVLYVEKTKPEMLPYLLNVKSPQQITGLLMKALISKQMSIPPEKIYHLSIMPCFDKKLEAARPEIDSTAAPLEQDVDCVLTPKEFIGLLKEENINYLDYITKSGAPPTALYQQASPQHWPFPLESWSSNIGSPSGGYALNYILALQTYYQNQGLLETEIKEIKGKNADVLEYQLINLEDGTKLGSSAIVNGFRNIQNLVRKLKPSGKVKIGSGLQARRKARMTNRTNGDDGDSADPSSCDFVEVMACPGGCINGGGINQVSLSESSSSTSDKEHMNKLITKYGEEFEDIKELKNVGFLGQFIEEFKNALSIGDDRIFKYKFNAVEKATDILSVGSKW